MTLIEMRSNPRMYKSLEGMYHGGDFDPPTMVLLCDCGREFEVARNKFPGRRRMRSCGEDDCEYSKIKEVGVRRTNLGRPRSDDPGTITQVYMPGTMKMVLRDQADKVGMSVSSYVVSLLRAVMPEE